MFSGGHNPASELPPAPRGGGTECEPPVPAVNFLRNGGQVRGDLNGFHSVSPIKEQALPCCILIAAYKRLGRSVPGDFSKIFSTKFLRNAI